MFIDKHGKKILTKIKPHGKAQKYHLPCDYCPSSDAVTLYLHPKGHLYKRCYSCSKIWDADKEHFLIKEKEQKPITNLETKSSLTLPDYVPGSDFWGRAIDEATWDAFGVATNEDGSRISFPFYDASGNLVAIKHKTHDKEFKWQGDVKRATLFGSNLWKDKGFRKAVTITEGMEDALACYQMFDGKYAVVSIKSGAQAGSRDLLPEDIKFLEQFEEIVIMFDADEPGRKGAQELAKSFSKSKVSIVTLGMKDANEYLKAGKSKEFRDAWYSKAYYRPDNLIYSSETQSLISEYDPKPDAFYPYEGLNQLLWGLYKPSLVVVTAGSGVGKTQAVKDLLLNLFQTTDDKIGCLFLEESVKQSIYQLISMDMKSNINNPEIYEKTNKNDIHASWKKLFSSDRWMFWDHFGSSSLDAVCEQVRYLSANFGASWIVLDHVSIVVSSQENGDERKALDEIMTRLRKLCEELRIGIILVSHLKRPNGSDSHEEGGITSLAQLRGSAGIGQLADVVLGLERNGQHEDEFLRNLVTVRVLKSRKTGRTGPACYLLYDPDASSFTEVRKDAIENHVEELKAAKTLRKTIDEPIMDEMLGTREAA